MREVDNEASKGGDEIQYRAEWRNEQVDGRVDVDFSNVCTYKGMPVQRSSQNWC